MLAGLKGKVHFMISIKTIDVDIERALQIAWDFNIYSYDACYLESAQRLGLSLLTFDAVMAKVGKELGITILGG